jgi:hypothetical protein
MLRLRMLTLRKRDGMKLKDERGVNRENSITRSVWRDGTKAMGKWESLANPDGNE